MNESQSNPDQQESTYIINTEDGLETARLTRQAKQVNTTTGLFPHGFEGTLRDTKILDIGSGTGDWVLDVAFEYPYSTVVGLDISKTLIDYAIQRAKTQMLPNAEFECLDVLTGLTGWPAEQFDSIHLRFAAGWVPKEEWLPLLKDCVCMLKPGGRFISTEGEWPYTTSKALSQLTKLLTRAMYNAGIGLSSDGESQGVVARMGGTCSLCFN